MSFTKATKQNIKIRMAIVGPAGSGKTFSALTIARGLSDRVALIDSEHGSAAKYADLFDFDTVSLENHSPQTYINMVHEAEAAGYGCLVIDSLSHAWNGVGGALEMVDAAAAANRGNSFACWKNVTPLHRRLIDAIIGSKMHIIATMRAKTEYIIEDIGGKKVPRKVGTGPVQRDGVEFEFDIVGELDQSHSMTVTKTRCQPLDSFHDIPGVSLVEHLKNWLTSAPAEHIAQPTAQKHLASKPAATTKTGDAQMKRDIAANLEAIGVPKTEIKEIAPWLIESSFSGDIAAAHAGIATWIKQGFQWDAEARTFRQAENAATA